MSKKSRTSKKRSTNGHAEKSAETFAVRVTEREIRILREGVQYRMDGMSQELADGSSDSDGHRSSLHDLKICVDLEEKLNAGIGYFENEYYNDPRYRQKHGGTA